MTWFESPDGKVVAVAIIDTAAPIPLDEPTPREEIADQFEPDLQTVNGETVAVPVPADPPAAPAAMVPDDIAGPTPPK